MGLASVAGGLRAPEVGASWICELPPLPSLGTAPVVPGAHRRAREKGLEERMWMMVSLLTTFTLLKIITMTQVSK